MERYCNYVLMFKEKGEKYSWQKKTCLAYIFIILLYLASFLYIYKITNISNIY